MDADFGIGGEFAGYRIEALVGRGGMGVVYRAEQIRLGRMVAVKVLAPDLAEDETFRERFERESRLAALIDHPNILPVYEAGEAEGLLFIAMRWVEGSDLRKLLQREGSLDSERARILLGQVAGALDAAHARGLVHRDLKPANVLVAGAGAGRHEHVYLSDFGIAKIASGTTALTRTGFFVGTPDYAAPEQFEDGTIDWRVDVYALGCLLYECLTGSAPYVRTQDVAVMYAHLNDPPPRPSEQRPDLPIGLDAVIATAMAKGRDDRYQTCGELMAAAEVALEAPTAPTAADATVARPPAEPARTDGSSPPAEPTLPLPPSPPPPSRRRWLAAALAAVVILVAGGAVAAVLALRSDDGGGEEAATTNTPTVTTRPGTGTTGPDGTTGPALDWQRVEDRAALGGVGQQQISRLATTGNGSIVAAGSQGPARAHDAVVWTSSPGELAFAKEVLGDEGEEVAYGVTSVGGDASVAVGYSQADPPRGDTDAAVWRGGGEAWERAGVPFNPFFEKMNRVATNPRTGVLAAVGAAGEGYYANGDPLPTDAAVWLSYEDAGASWGRAGEEALVKDGYQEAWAVAPYGDGFVGVGHDQGNAAVWRGDGGDWRQLDPQPDLAAGGGLQDLDMRALSGFRGGLVAVGDVCSVPEDECPEVGDRDAAVWLSEDGETWTRITAADLGGPGAQRALGVVTGTFGIVAVGCSNCDTAESTAAVWTSEDGREWTLADDPVLAASTPVQLNDVAVAGDLIVAAGWDESAADRDAAVWVAPLPSP